MFRFAKKFNDSIISKTKKAFSKDWKKVDANSFSNKELKSTYLEDILQNVEGYNGVKSINTNSSIPFDQYLLEINPVFFEEIGTRILSNKKQLTAIVETLSFAVINLGKIDIRKRINVFQALMHTFEYLKNACGYPSNVKIDKEKALCIPLFKKLCESANIFLTKNK
ncbi:MAG: hypothetical protein ACRC42_00270 [Mycoplasma sp.]